MCGFVGVLMAHAGDIAPASMAGRAAQALRHRGPDAQGVHADGPFAAAHRRLRVLDRTPRGDQPMTSADGRLCLVYNGEIYNAPELARRHDVSTFPGPPRSRTDTEILLRLLERRGFDCLPELDGMFAFALWDRRRGSLWLARDPFGIKPLFYAVTRNALWFASEIPALLEVPGIDREIDLEALHHYLSLAYIPGTLTPFAGIRELRPGHLLVATGGDRLEISIRRFWAPRTGDRLPEDIDATVQQVRSLIDAAVARQRVADVPVGVMLSGGMDSSTLTATLARVAGGPDFHTFSIGFDEPSFDETRPSHIMARYAGTQHHHVRVTPAAVLDHLETCVARIGEPYADGSAIPTWLLAREASRYVTVLLSGEGGDELFAGYDTHRAYLARAVYRKVPPAARRVVRRAAGRLPVSHAKLSLDFKIKRFVSAAEASVPVSHFRWRQVFSEAEKRALLEVSPARLDAIGPTERLFEVLFDAQDTPDTLNRLLAIDTAYHLPDDLMVKNDRMTMAHSVEARVPFTDRALVEFVSTLSSSVKLRRGRGKWLLKRAMADRLPLPILWKRKVGLEMPYSTWFCGPWREFLLDTLAPSALSRIPLINGRFVTRLVEEHLEHRADRGRALWTLVNLVVWHRQHFGS